MRDVMARTTTNDRPHNGAWWKVLVGVAMTLVLAALALAGTWGGQKATVAAQGVRITTVESSVKDLQAQTTRVDANQKMMIRQLDSQDEKLDTILKEMRQP